MSLGTVLRSEIILDEKVQKLPRYVFRRPNGSFRYKRNVPKRLVGLLGKKTLYRQLGNSYAEAMKAFPYVHARIESMLEVERKKTSRDRAIELVRSHLGDKIAEQVLAGKIVEYSHEEDDLIELAESLDGKVAHTTLEQIYQGTLWEDPLTLTRILDEYLEFKTIDGELDRDTRTRVARIRKEMTHLYGKQKMDEVAIENITRSDANQLRDMLLAKMAPNSVQRTIGIVKAAVNLAITEHGLTHINVFANLRIKGAGASRSDRRAITEDQLARALPAFASNATAEALFVTLADTGARLSEIIGLEVCDVDLENRVVHIRPNKLREPKTRTSERSVPLSQRAAEVLKDRQSGLSDGAPIFPKYARPRGSDAASAMLMKRLRTEIADPKVTMHSLRHRMKDKLRNTGCQESLSKEILGHSQGSVAANYGSGYALEVMREALSKVWAE